MSSVSETLVREFFEMRGFLVRQVRKYVGPDRSDDRQADLLVYNPHPEPRQGPLPVELSSSDISKVEQGVVVVKGWHTETVCPSLLDAFPDMYKILGTEVFKSASVELNAQVASLTRILVVPDLPASPQSRARVFEALKRRGVDCVITFRTVLTDIIARIEPNRNYQKADLLQVIRILKVYGFLKDDFQLELFDRVRRRRRIKGQDTGPPSDAPPS